MPCDVLKKHENKQTESPNEPNQTLSWSSWLCLFVLWYVFLHFVSTSHVVPTLLESQNIDCSAQYSFHPLCTPHKKRRKKMPCFIYLLVLIVFLLLVIEPLNKFAPVSGNQQLNKLLVPVDFLWDQCLRLVFFFFFFILKTASELDLQKHVSAGLPIWR